MMNNLFSMFDPSSYYASSGWIMAYTVLFTIPMSMYLSKNFMLLMIKSITNKMELELLQLMGNKSKKMSSKSISKMFFTVMTLNTLALVPFNFTLTAHLTVSLLISLTFWVSTITNGWINNTNHMMVHMTPMGTPNALMNFMVVIEMASNMIRPITLSVRLSANMVAGHLLISLLSNFSMMSNTNTVLSSLIMMVLGTLEIMVAMIQAYVIATLTVLYQNESL